MGLLDFLGGQNSQPLMALSQALLQAGAPSRVPVSNAQALGAGLMGYKSGLDKKNILDALNNSDMKTATGIMLSSQDPELQKMGMKAMEPYDLSPGTTRMSGMTNQPIASTGLFGGVAQSGGVSPGANLRGDDFLKALPSPTGDLIKAYAEGRQQISPRLASTAQGQQLLSAITQYDPSFDAVNYNARASTRKDFTSGKAAQNITALNTSIGHINSLLDNADALHNTDYPIWNRITNTVADATGDPRIKQFNTTKDAVADELTRVFRGTGGSESDIQSWKEKLNAANSPDQFKGVAKQMADLLSSRLDALGSQYNQGMGTSKKGIELLNPHAQAVFQRLEGGVGQAANPASSGIKFLGFE